MHKSFEEIVQKTNSDSRVKVFEFTDKVPELMSISNVVVTKAGRINYYRKLSI